LERKTCLLRLRKRHLKLVLENSTKKTSKITYHYDRLETQLRALESLGVTQDKNGAMWYPLVESCLPEETMRTWERQRNNFPSIGNALQSLMQFLRIEANGEERVELAKNTFTDDGNSSKEYKKKAKDKRF